MKELDEAGKLIKETRIHIIHLMKERQTKIVEVKEIDRQLRKRKEYLSALYAQVAEFNKKLARK
jgi:hypothetical protein